MIRLATIWLAATGLAIALGAQAGNLGEGYKVCAACHGADGSGNKDLNAPRIAGLPAAYVERQLNYFKAGVRGADSKDVFGTQMRPMAMILTDDAAVAEMSQYVASLDAPAAPATVEGDVEKGKAAYATCAACHGAAGEGVAALNAPPLAGQADWYIVRQLQAYKQGLRGTHKDDTFGMQMRPMAMMLADDQAIRDIAAYIATLE